MLAEDQESKVNILAQWTLEECLCSKQDVTVHRKMLFSVIQKFIGYWAVLWEDAADPGQVSFLLSVYKFSPKEKQDWWSALNQNRRTALELTEQYHTAASTAQLQPQLPLLFRLLLAAQVASKMYNEPTKNHQQTSDDVIESLSHISMQSIASASDGQTPDLEVSTPTSSPNSIIHHHCLTPLLVWRTHANPVRCRLFPTH